MSSAQMGWVVVGFFLTGVGQQFYVRYYKERYRRVPAEAPGDELVPLELVAVEPLALEHSSIAQPEAVYRASECTNGAERQILVRPLPNCIPRQGFGRQANKPNGNGNGSNNQQRGNGSQTSSPTTYAPTMPPLKTSASFSSTLGSNSENSPSNADLQMEPEPTKFFFREKYARLGVRGNFMPLAAQPKNVDLGEWLAHQAVEQYRLVESLLQCIQEVDANTGLPICNPRSCPVMSAGRHTYTWLNNEKVPIKVPASQYISLVQRWIVGKIHDPKAFPTDSSIPSTSTASTYASGGLNTPGSTTPIPLGPTNLTTPLSQLAGHDWVGKKGGFPETFFGDVKTIFRQIFRLYGHMYHSHWVDPFWHITSGSNGNGWTDLNSCFVHYVSVAKLFGLLSDKDLEPLQPLIDIWIANGSIPADAANGACTIVPPQ